jgi:hypothetical protein
MRVSNFQRWKPDRDVNMELVLTEWDGSANSQWVRAEDAIRRESQLLERIRALEEQADKAASLIAAAIEIVSPSKKNRA